jgi:hypothetical protein
MPFSSLYTRLVESEKKIAPPLLRPKNIYKLNVYEYSDGKIKTLSGIRTSIIFLLGIHQKKLICIKISDMKPELFFNWLSKLFKKELSHESFDKATRLEDLLMVSDLAGNLLFSKFKSSPLYRLEPSVYRTYSMTGIKNIEQLDLKKDILKKTYGLPAVPNPAEPKKVIKTPVTDAVVKRVSKKTSKKD